MSLASETRTGSVEHNGTMGLDEETPFSPELGPPGRTASSNHGKRNTYQPDTESQAAAAYSAATNSTAFLGKAFEEKPIWAGLYESIQRRVFPRQAAPA